MRDASPLVLRSSSHSQRPTLPTTNMAFQSNEDHFLFVSPDMRPFHHCESWECPDSTAQDLGDATCCSHLDTPQYYWSDGSIFGLLTGMAAIPFHTQPLHTPQVLVEPSDQQVAHLPGF